MCIALFWSIKSLWLLYYFLESFFIKGNVFHIYHNIRYQHRLKGPQGVSDRKPAMSRQQTTRKPARNAQALFLRHAWVCALCIARGNSRHSAGVKSCFRRSSHPKTVNGDAIYCVAVKRCRHKGGKPVSARSGIRVRRRPAITLWQVARTTHHTIHRRFDSWLDSRVTTVR